jgi:hypothetical protein
MTIFVFQNLPRKNGENHQHSSMMFFRSDPGEMEILIHHLRVSVSLLCSISCVMILRQSDRLFEPRN